MPRALRAPGEEDGKMKYIVSRRNKKWGYGWTNRVEHDERRNLRVCEPAPEATGLTFSQLQEQHRIAAKINSGNDCRFNVYYNGELVVGVEGAFTDSIWIEIVSALEDWGVATIYTQKGN